MPDTPYDLSDVSAARLPDELYACRVDLMLTVHDLATASARLAAMQHEIITLTRLLAEAQVERTDHVKALADTDLLASAAARQRQQLEALGAEFAAQTRLLAAAEDRAQRAEQAAQDATGWLRALVALLVTGPDGTARPAADLAQLGRRMVAAGIFDPDWYLATNGDVKAGGAEPAQHFLLHGLAEGRLPRAAAQAAADRAGPAHG
ncbi:hypothetical protein GEU84_019205 [Fertoebacter nigrum]|uniref:Uncharacterized protein n=1 Tax=Fertoeibacter niger TaxID=2656921 RepID=A0A8X8H393_9RHOB|nr:hypothetical protein [Fertoeibacter niger]NUB46526.1 hypothetical protein [Fertoeibacter niger]